MSQTLSIIIPTYKRRDSLVLLLETLSVQKDIVPEIIIVDQNPPGFLDDCIPAAANIRRLVLDRPNASDARNKGFLQSSGDFVLFIDDDLVPEPNFCSSGMAIFAAHPSIDCFSPLVYNKEGKEPALHLAEGKSIARLSDNAEIFSITDTISAALFFRRDYYRKTGGFDPLLFDFAKTAEDQEFFLRMQKKGLALYFVPGVTVFHDETVPGGCDLRTAEYWITREKCMKAWAYRYRIHDALPGNLSLKAILQLSRSGFLNREGLSSGIGKMFRQIGVLRRAIRSSHAYLKDKLGYYIPADRMDHLQ